MFFFRGKARQHGSSLEISNRSPKGRVLKADRAHAGPQEIPGAQKPTKAHVVATPHEAMQKSKVPKQGVTYGARVAQQKGVKGIVGGQAESEFTPSHRTNYGAGQHVFSSILPGIAKKARVMASLSPPGRG